MPHVNGATEGLVRRLAMLLAGIALLVVYGVVGFLVLGMGPIDSLYFTVLAITTLGPPETELSTVGKLFTASLAMLGVTAFLAAVAMLAATLVEGRLPTIARRRRMQRKIEDLSDHVIVCAYGRVGRTVARELEAEGAPFVVIDSDADLEQQMQADGVVYLIADPASEAVLRRVRIDRARALVCAVDSDAHNVFITLMARSMNPDALIVARAAEEGSAERLYRAGANRVVSPYATSGRHMALHVLRPRVLESVPLAAKGGRDVRIDELMVDEGSPMVGRTLGEACPSAVPLLVRRAGGEIVARPDGGERLGPGDVVMLLGDPEALRPVEE